MGLRFLMFRLYIAKFPHLLPHTPFKLVGEPLKGNLGRKKPPRLLQLLCSPPISSHVLRLTAVPTTELPWVLVCEESSLADHLKSQWSTREVVHDHLSVVLIHNEQGRGSLGSTCHSLTGSREPGSPKHPHTIPDHRSDIASGRPTRKDKTFRTK